MILSENYLHRIINEVINDVLSEDGAGAVGGGGATNCAGTMQGGGTNPGAGQYDVPFGGMVRRKKYSPKGDKTSKGMTQVDMSDAYDRSPGFSVNGKSTGKKRK